MKSDQGRREDSIEEGRKGREEEMGRSGEEEGRSSGRRT